MTEKVKKATAKARKTVATIKPAEKRTRKSQPTPIAMPTATMPSHEEIALLAYIYWERRGRTHGSPEQDWFCAEQELLKEAS